MTNEEAAHLIARIATDADICHLLNNQASEALRMAEAALRAQGELAEIGRLIATQNNRITDSPIFIVQQKRKYVTDDGYNDCEYEWHETESGEYGGPEDDAEHDRLEAHFAETREEPDGWKRLPMFHVWEFVTACFTEQGCNDYIARNGHNLHEPRIYAEGSYRNEEFRTVRKFLMSLAAPHPQGEEHGQG
jgi:hypothetical protein